MYDNGKYIGTFKNGLIKEKEYLIRMMVVNMKADVPNQPISKMPIKNAIGNFSPLKKYLFKLSKKREMKCQMPIKCHYAKNQ